MLAMVSVAPPEFVSVTVCGLVVTLTTTLPNVRLVGANATAGAGGAIPMPDRSTLLGLVAAFVVNVKLADRDPSTVGVKVVLTVQVPLAAKLAPQVLLAMVKSEVFAPVSAILLIVSAAVPVL